MTSVACGGGSSSTVMERPRAEYIDDAGWTWWCTIGGRIGHASAVVDHRSSVTGDLADARAERRVKCLAKYSRWCPDQVGRRRLVVGAPRRHRAGMGRRDDEDRSTTRSRRPISKIRSPCPTRRARSCRSTRRTTIPVAFATTPSSRQPSAGCNRRRVEARRRGLRRAERDLPCARRRCTRAGLDEAHAARRADAIARVVRDGNSRRRVPMAPDREYESNERALLWDRDRHRDCEEQLLGVGRRSPTARSLGRTRFLKRSSTPSESNDSCGAGAGRISTRCISVSPRALRSRVLA